MRTVGVGLALLVLIVTPSLADEHDLSDGVFICHHDPDCLATDGAEQSLCDFYLENCAIEDPADQNPSILMFEETFWLILSAFTEEKRWCGTEFGFGEFPLYAFVFTQIGPCAPGPVLEIPTPNWPGPQSGVAIVTTGEPWFGHLEPVYYFVGYAYDYPGLIPVAADPATDFVGWANCLTPPESFTAVCLPGLGIMMPGIRCEPELQPGACCIGEDCYLVLEEECAEMGGEWHPGYDCGPDNPCLPRAACCVCEECHVTTEPQCWDLGGEWHREWPDCDPNPCPPSAPGVTSWGTIKSVYR